MQLSFSSLVFFPGYFFFVPLSVCVSAQVFDEFVPELLLDPVPLLEVVPQNGDLANLKE